MNTVFAFSLSSIGSLLLFILIICFLIAWHELGHLFCAKKCNVYCYEYSIGFGPVLFRNKKHETHFVIRAIPLGGFVKMAGEEGVEAGQVVKDNNDNIVPQDRILGNKSCGKRAIVMAAGGLMNIILSVVCFYFVIAGSGGFSVMKYDNRVSIMEVNENAEYSLATKGLTNGSKIIKIETKSSTEKKYLVYTIDKYYDVIEALDSKKPTSDGQIQELRITYLDQNNNEAVVETSRFAYYPTNPETGIVSEELALSKIGLGQYYINYDYNYLTATYGVWHFAGYYTSEICRAFGRLFTGDLSSLSGLVGIYQTVDDVATGTYETFGMKLLNIIYLIGAISFSLGFFNLIPFPALDGGRLVFVAIEAIFKKKVNPNIEATIHFVGIILLFALMIIINVKDIFNLF